MTTRPLACIDWFIDQRESEGCKPRTLEGYRRQITAFVRDMNLQDISELSPRHAIEWTKILRLRGMKSGGINSTQRPVWTWFRWLYDQDIIAIDISRKVKKVPARDVKRRTASEDDRDALVAVVLEGREHPRRNVAIIELLWASGIRREELTRLAVQDYDRTEGTLEVYGKNDTRRTVVVDARARAALWAYLERERGKAPGPLFLGRGGRSGVTATAIKNMLRKAAAAAGIEVSAHDFRRACASNMLAAGVGIDSVMYQLGHSTMTMSLTYGALGRKTRAHAEIRKMQGRTG